LILAQFEECKTWLGVQFGHSLDDDLTRWRWMNLAVYLNYSLRHTIQNSWLFAVNLIGHASGSRLLLSDPNWWQRFHVCVGQLLFFVNQNCFKNIFSDFSVSI